MKQSNLRPPQLTSLQIQAIQTKEFETLKQIAFASTLSVLQDLGYTVESASMETGFITAKSPTQTNSGANQFWTSTVKNSETKVTAFIEQLKPTATRVRLNFVNSEQLQRLGSAWGGAKQVKDTPVLDPLPYQNAFTKIEEAIFIRTGERSD